MTDQRRGGQQRCGPILQQGVAATRRQAPGITGHHPNWALELVRQSGRDQRAASLRALNDDNGAGEGHQQPISGSEMPSLNRRARPMLRQQQT
tara:strand:+ start:204 stop:482 length:279 start_codon:yes stop_codon:yes gene_type:complete